MATPAEIAVVRERTNEPTTDVFSDARINEIIDGHGSDLNLSSAEIWRAKASRYADLVDVQEGSSRRSLGDLYEQAVSMAVTYQSQSAAPTPSTGMRPGRTRPITRP